MTGTSKAVVFQVNREEYAIPIQYVISIEKIERITSIPHLPDCVKGLARVRDELIPVIDFEFVLYGRFIEGNDAARLIVLKTDEMTLGIAVKEAKEIIDIPPDKIKQVGLLAYDKTKYFTGVANLENRLITIIDPAILVQSLDEVGQIEEYMQSRQI